KAVVAAWQGLFEDQQVLVRQGVAKAQETLLPQEQEQDSGNPYVNPELRDALTAVAGDDRGNINTRGLGYWLRGNKDKVVLLEGISYRLTQAGVEHRTTTWQVVRVEKAAPQGEREV